MREIVGVREHLARRFAGQRVVLRQDPEVEGAADLEAVDLPGVSVVQVARDEYAIKSWPLDEDPTGKLLAYRKGAAPSCVDNWPLERELAHGLFSVGRTSLSQNDLGLTWDGVDEVVRVHVAFGVTYMNEGREA